ncbi:GIY-YIG nuclease family protein [uncultured Dokdonia sp.]|uniref:GIY-YIG nuclease family protein n=1 Tax=uncultured Dokdonia sp. TaxID=575653 RepID=UPI00263565DD|nr:GIY-YIG nuclease family protein [uncultured Dokdonia sp.]
MKPGFIYILTNKNNTTLYIGVTAYLKERIIQHKEKVNKRSFTARYNLNKLVYYEAYQMIGDAIAREKQLKGGSRAQKIALIESINPQWNDLFEKCVREFE